MLRAWRPVLGCAWLAWACAAAAQPTEPIPPSYPVEAFARLPFLQSPELSPDGTQLAARAPVGGRYGLTIVPLFEKDARPAVVAMPGDAELIWHRWASDDRLIASIGTLDRIEGRDVMITRLISVRRDGSDIRQLNWQSGSQVGDDLVYVPPRGGPAVLLASRETIYSNLDGFYPKVVRIDVTTGRVIDTVVEGRSPVLDWLADSAGTIRFGVGYDHQRNRGVLVYRSSDKAAFRTIDRADFNRDDELLTPVHVRSGSNKAIVASDHDGHTALYEYDLGSNERGAKFVGDDRYDIDGIVKSSDGATIIGVSYSDERPRIRWLAPEYRRLQERLDAAARREFAEIVSFSADHRRLLVQTSSPTSPGSLYFMDRSDGAMRRIGQVNAALEGARLAPMKAVTYKARDGLDIPAYLTLPVGRTAKGLPLIVLPHGGPATRDVLGYDYWVQFLANRGYAVLQPNYRGSAGYGTGFEDAADGQWGLAMQDDITDGVRWLVADGTVDAKRVCIMGASYGGYAALQGVVRDPDLYRCSIAYAGVSHLASQVRFDRKFLLGKRWLKAQRKAAPDFGAVSPANHAARIKAPVLLVHGRKDLIVPYSQSKRMYQALVGAGKRVEFITQPLGDHHLSRQENRVGFLAAVDAFLKKHNPAE